MRFFSEEAHARTMRNGPDVPGQRPSFPLSLDEVGIANKTVWVRLPQGRIPFAARLTVQLEGGRRGIHMSRMEDAISTLGEDHFPTVSGYALALVDLLQRGQQCVTACVVLEGKLPVESRTLISGRISSDMIELACRASTGIERPGCRIALRVGVWHMTVCPCTQIYAQTALAVSAPPWPLPSHSQRSRTALEVEGDELAIEPEQLHRILRHSLHACQDLLKRPDEAELVLKAHLHPQFAEDAVREAARAVAERLAHLPAATVVRIESRSLESIHLHDVVCGFSSTLGQLRMLAESEVGRGPAAGG